MSTRLLIVVVVVAFGAANAAASEDSELLKARGLVQFHARDYAAAEQSFDEAVRSDGEDYDALYYRGVTRGRLHDYGRAVADLRAVLAKRPELARAALELGVALFDSGAYRDSLAPLERARRSADVRERAAYFLGVAELRLEQNAAAEADLRIAAESDELRVPARYYEGVAQARQREVVSARDRFTYVTTTTPTSAMGRDAAAYLTDLRPYHLYGSVGLDYDSNVQLAPADDAVKTAVGVHRRSDGAAEVTVGGTYMPWATDEAQLWLGYEFFQSLYFDLSEFDLEDHRATATFTASLGPVLLGVLGRYDYYLLGDDRFLQEGVVAPSLSIPEEGVGRTEVYYRERWRGFIKRPFRGLRDAFNHSPGVRQVLYLDGASRYLFAGYRFDREDTINDRGDAFSYDGHEIEGGVGWQFPAGVEAELSYAYRHETYDQPSDDRKDDEHQVTFWARKQLSEHLAVRCSYLGDFNDSTKTQFEYVRHVGSVAMEVRF